MFHELPIAERRVAFEQSLAFQRARRQIARLQAVLDHGEGDLARAQKIIDRFESAIEHCFGHDAYVAICNVTCSTLTYTLNEWAAAVDSCCWSIENLERAA
jgi:hypothetical protein